MNRLDEKYWSQRWENKQTGWDIGYVSPAIVRYMLENIPRDASVLIPGCGNAYEADFLLKNGFTNITLIDIAPKVCDTLAEKFVGNHAIKLLCEDYFEHQGQYDVQIEQTFFCAISPVLRDDYVRKSASLLCTKGILVGLWFASVFAQEGPPFGGEESEYRTLFSPLFDIKRMSLCLRSIPQRQGNELFVEMKKK